MKIYKIHLKDDNTIEVKTNTYAITQYDVAISRRYEYLLQ